MTQEDAAKFYNEIMKKSLSLRGAAAAKDAPVHIDTLPFDPVESSKTDSILTVRLKDTKAACSKAAQFLLWLSQSLDPPM